MGPTPQSTRSNPWANAADIASPSPGNGRADLAARTMDRRASGARSSAKLAPSRTAARTADARTRGRADALNFSAQVTLYVREGNYTVEFGRRACYRPALGAARYEHA